MSILPVTQPKENEGPSVLGTVARSTFKVTQAIALGVGGVALMCIGGAGIALTLDRGYQFYKGDEGLKDFPGFGVACHYSCGHIDSFFGSQSPSNSGGTEAGQTPTEEQTQGSASQTICNQFCDSILNKPFSEQSGLFKPAALITTFGTGVLSLLGSTYCFLGGVALIGRSFEVFISAL